VTTAPRREPVAGRRRPPRRRRRSWQRALLALAVVAAAFAAGIALGEAISENPRPSNRSEVRTLVPRPVEPVPQTVTVTVPRS
jgi:hypothetical protein